MPLAPALRACPSRLPFALISCFVFLMGMLLAASSCRADGHPTDAHASQGAGAPTASPIIGSIYSTTAGADNGPDPTAGVEAQKVPDFSVTLSSTSTTLLVGAGGGSSSTATVSPINGFTGDVLLTVSGSGGISCGVSPSKVTLGTSQTGTLSVSVPSGTPAGTYSVVVTGTCGTLSHSATFTVNVSDFTLSVDPAALTVPIGSSRLATVTVNGLYNFSDSVSLTASGLPTGASVAFSPTSVSGSGSSAAAFSAGTNTPTGTYQITITGTCGSLTRKTSLSFTVVNFSLSVYPAIITIPVGGTGSTTVTVTGLAGFTGNVSLSASGQPSGVSAVFAPVSVTATGNSTLTFTAGQSAVPGKYPMTISGTYGSATVTIPMTLNVTDFNIAADPDTFSLAPGSSASTTITLTPLYGFTGGAALTIPAASLPSGMSASFTPASVSAGSPSTLTLTTTAAVALNTYSIPVTATANGVVRIATLTVTVSPNPQPTVAIGRLYSPLIGNPSGVYAGVPCRAAVSATMSNPPGYSASYFASWSYSTVYIVYSTTGNDETWVAPNDGTSAAVTLNGASTNSAGTLNATFKTVGYYEVCIAATVTYTNPANGQTLGPFTGYGFASTGDPSSYAPAAGSAKPQVANAAAGVPATPGKPKVAVQAPILIVHVNGTADTTDDKYVRLKSSHPAGILYAIPVIISNPNPVPMTVKVSCPNGKLGFFESDGTANITAFNWKQLYAVPTDSSTITFTVPSGDNNGGTWYFYVTGENMSTQVGDTEIDITDAKTGVSYEKEKLTVFGFTAPQMNTTVGSNYGLIASSAPGGSQTQIRLTASPFAITLSAQATLVPAGVNYAIPQIKGLQLGIVQDGTTRSQGATFTNPSITWQGQPKIAVQYILTYPTLSGNVNPITSSTNDSDKVNQPFIRRSPLKDSASGNQIATGLVTIESATTVCTDVDNPSFGYVSPYFAKVQDSESMPQQVSYNLTQATLNAGFKDWCTIYDSRLPSGSQDEWLCESSWATNIDVTNKKLAATAGTQQNSTSFSDVPVETDPTCNDILSDPNVMAVEFKGSGGFVKITFPDTHP